MKTIIATLFILDFSGSMYQKIVDKSKYQVLQTKMTEMSSTYKGQVPIAVSSFGQKGNTSCNDVRFDQMNFDQLPRWIKSQKPGAYSKTPLAKAIESVAEATKKHHFQQVVIVTDGADSCGADPCEALQKLAKTLEKQKTPLLMDLVGYDVKLNAKKLECANIKSNALKYRFHIAQNDTDLSKQLVKIDRKIKKQNATNIILSGKKSEAEKFLNSQKKQDLPKSSQLAQTEENSNDQTDDTFDKPINLFSPELRLDDELLSSVRIVNPPNNRLFYAYRKGKLIKKWNGEFAAVLPPGEYSIRTFDKKNITQNLKLTIEPKKNKLISFKLFLKDPTPHLIVKSTLFPIKVSPVKGNTIRNEDLSIPERIEGEHVLALGEGEWAIEIYYPWWLKKPLKKIIRLAAGEKRVLDFRKIHSNSIKWIATPNSSRDLAVLLTTEFGNEFRVFVPKGSKKTPVLKSWDPHWLGL